MKELFPEAESYTDVYHRHNLLTDKVSRSLRVRVHVHVRLLSAIVPSGVG